MIRLKDELTDVKTVAISGHIRPDGDCTGSCLGVWNYLRDNYPEIQADVYLEQIVPKFRFLNGAEVKDLYTGLVAVVDYKGHRFRAQSAVPSIIHVAARAASEA